MAKTNSVFLLSLLLIFFISSSSSSDDEFNIYQFMLQWNPATCSDIDLPRRCPIIPGNRFTISGLWPTRTTPFEIFGPCRGSELDRDNIRSLEPMLNRNWPNVITGRAEFGLWREEWRKHGTCSEEYLEQFDYFSLALNINDRYNMVTILTTSGIRANESNYRRDDVQAAISRAIGVRPGLRCNRNYLSKTTQLHEIVLCKRKDDESFINCISRINTCPSRFDWFPYMRTYQGYFQIVLPWQPAVCNSTSVGLQPCSRAPQNRFSIGGVWPTSRANRVLGPCEGSNFDANQIFTIQTSLARDWPDLSNNGNQGLWRNEWRNHGTCSENDFRQLEFFSLGLFVFQGNDIMNILVRNGINPNGRTLYQRQQVEDVLRRATRSRPYITCNARRVAGQGSRTQLYQVVLCYDEFGRSPIDCPLPAPPSLRNCPNTFYWFPV